MAWNGNKILATGLLVLALGWWAAAPAAAADTALRAGVSYGTRDSTALDLYLQRTFDPWVDRETYSLSPYVNLGATFWFADKNDHPQARTDRVWGLVTALGLRLDLKTWESAHPYLAFNVGPSYISEDYFMDRDMGGGHFLFNLRASLGMRFGENFGHNLSVDASHFSNAYTQRANKGYNALGLSYGYSFW